MGRFDAIVQSLSRVLDWIAQGAVVAMVLLVIANILARFIWLPIKGTYEWVQFLGVVIISFALAHCAVQRGHVAVAIVVDRLPQRTQAIVDIITGILGVAIFSLIAWQCAVEATDMWQSGEKSWATRVTYYPFMYGLSFGFLALCLVVLVGVCKSVAKALRK